MERSGFGVELQPAVFKRQDAPAHAPPERKTTMIDLHLMCHNGALGRLISRFGKRCKLLINNVL